METEALQLQLISLKEELEENVHVHCFSTTVIVACLSLILFINFQCFSLLISQ